MFPLITRLSGVTFGDAQENIKRYGMPGLIDYDLIREPDNPNDPNAIRVVIFGNDFMGYIPKRIARDIAPMMVNGRIFVAEFYRLNKSPAHKTLGLTVRIVEVGQQQEQQAHWNRADGPQSSGLFAE